MGQSVPILVRPQPTTAGPFRSRVLGIDDCGLLVTMGSKFARSCKDLTDEQLVIAQGQENSGRTDLYLH